MAWALLNRLCVEGVSGHPTTQAIIEEGRQMMIPRRILKLLLILTGVVVLVAPTAALAVYEITVSGAVPTFTCVNGAGCDTNPAANAITIALGENGVPIPAGIMGGTYVTFTLTGPTMSTLDVTFSLQSGGMAGNIGNPLIVTASNTGYTTPASGQATLFDQINGNFTLGSSATSTVTEQKWVTANVNFTDGPVVGTSCGLLGPFHPAAGGFSGSCSTSFNLTSPYGLVDRLSLQIGPNAGLSGDSFISVVPEPASLLLLGSGIIGLCLVLRRRS